MSFLNELKKQKEKLKYTDTIVTNADGKRFIENNTKKEVKNLPPNQFGFIVDTKPDNVPAQIIDNLFIGSQDCADPDVLQAYNITHVLSIGVNVPIKNVNHKFVECLDLPETDIKTVLEETTAFIDNALSFKDNILVHCNAGVSRASSVVIGYLILKCHMDYEEAFELVKMKRPAIQPNEGFRKQLKKL